MRAVPRFLPIWPLLLAAMIAFGASAARADDTRFSRTLKPEEKTVAGIAKLSSDQVAVLDALVRRDVGRPAATAKTDETEKIPSTFSARLSADERRNAGIEQLAAAERVQLDGFVDRYQSGKLARTLLAPMSVLSRSPASRLKPDETKPERKIHGQFSLSYGWGSGGYSEKTGSMSLYYDDPAGRYSIGVGYSETHVKGGPMIYRDPLYRDPLYDPVLPRP